MNELYIVCWKSNLTGFTGHSKSMSNQLASERVNEGNRKYGADFHHWKELARTNNWQSYAYRYKWLRDANTARNRTLLVAGIICVVGFIYIWRWW